MTRATLSVWKRKRESSGGEKREGNVGEKRRKSERAVRMLGGT